MSSLSESTYKHNTILHNEKSASIILPYIKKKYDFNSLLDVGCGLGTWSSVAINLGIKEVVAIDSPYVPVHLRTIPQEYFIEKDLTQPFNVGKSRFDLAICLEVAEHLPESSADSLVESLTKHADVILFSAAIPGQGGQNHINEQWPDYWQEKFSKYNFFAFDVLRNHFWDNENIDPWYRQNMLIYTKSETFLNELPTNKIPKLMHPDMFKPHILSFYSLSAKVRSPSVRFALKMLFRALKIRQ